MKSWDSKKDTSPEADQRPDAKSRELESKADQGPLGRRAQRLGSLFSILLSTLIKVSLSSVMEDAN